MSGSHDAIRRVVAAFERSDWAEIDVRSGGVRVHLATGVPAGSTSSPSAAARSNQPSEPAVDVRVDARDANVASTVATPPAGAHIVVSPSPGIFWRAPEPGAPPFAALGDAIDASATVCIVEVMKLMNHVKAGVDGEVVTVYVENGVPVQKGEPLFAIAPFGSS